MTGVTPLCLTPPSLPSPPFLTRVVWRGTCPGGSGGMEQGGAGQCFDFATAAELAIWALRNRDEPGVHM